MKQTALYIALAFIGFISFRCQKTGYGNYPGGDTSPYIAIYDVRNMYKGQSITFTKGNLMGSTSLAAVVISDHSGHNLPDSLMFVQDGRRLSQLRGIAINMGAAAKNYTPGDSVIINLEGAVLNKINGMYQLNGITEAAITRMPGKTTLNPVIVSAANLVKDLERYQSTFVAIVDGSFLPLPQSGDILSGNKNINDGSGNVTLRTNSDAAFAGNTVFGRANYYGIALNTANTDGSTKTDLVPRVADDIKKLSDAAGITPVIITGFMSDVKGGDGNYEYVQLMATRDIDFKATPYSVIVTNNAGASTPLGLPKNGWATGDMRTFKFNLTSGMAKKGTFFYVGGTGKMINGSGSTSMAASNWVRAFNYTTTNGDDGIGTKTGGLFANSGNPSGVAVFKGTKVDLNTEPVDVIFIGSATGELQVYDPKTNPALGYTITNNDLYKTLDLISLTPQPFYRSGNNIISFPYLAADLGYFNQLGGKYNLTMARWTQQRAQHPVLLEKTSPVTMIEDSLSTKLMRIDGSTEIEDK